MNFSYHEFRECTDERPRRRRRPIRQPHQSVQKTKQQENGEMLGGFTVLMCLGGMWVVSSIANENDWSHLKTGFVCFVSFVLIVVLVILIALAIDKKG